MGTVFRSLSLGIFVGGMLSVTAATGAEVVYVLAPTGWFGSGSLYARESIPYFAANPPVYYSHVTPRSYGGSPYPDLPAVRATQTAPSPRVVRNGFSADEQFEAERAAVRPLRIRNPYVEEEPAN